MAKTVETALRVNVLTICKAAKKSRSGVVMLEWDFGSHRETGIAAVVDTLLVLYASGKMYRVPISYREFRKDRFLPYIHCLACAKKCHILYLDGDDLQCRKCAGLIYECQRGHGLERAHVKVQKIVTSLGGRPGDTVPTRPAGMWRRTYLRRITQLAQARRELLKSAP